jgi:hypothetical protein
MTDVDKDELVIKHIPNDPTYQGKEIPAQVTSANFELRDDEKGSSISRRTFTSPIEMLSNLKCKVGSKVAFAKVREIMELDFVVVPVPEPHDVGHAEIRDGSKKLSSHPDRKKLKKLFQFLPLTVIAVDDSKVTAWF